MKAVSPQFTDETETRDTYYGGDRARREPEAPPRKWNVWNTIYMQI